MEHLFPRKNPHAARVDPQKYFNIRINGTLVY